MSRLHEAAAVSISVLQLQLEEPTAGASVNILLFVLLRQLEVMLRRDKGDI